MKTKRKYKGKAICICKDDSGLEIGGWEEYLGETYAVSEAQARNNFSYRTGLREGGFSSPSVGSDAKFLTIEVMEA